MRIAQDIVLFLSLLLSLSHAYTTTTAPSLLSAGSRLKTHLSPRVAFIVNSSTGTTSRIPTIRRTKTREASKSGPLFSSQWDEEENNEDGGGVTKTSPTYEEAGRAIGEEDDQEKMDDLGDFDESPNVSRVL